MKCLFVMAGVFFLAGCEPAARSPVHYQQVKEDMVYDLYSLRDAYILLWSDEDGVEYVEKGFMTNGKTNPTAVIPDSKLDTLNELLSTHEMEELLSYDSPLFVEKDAVFKRPPVDFGANATDEPKTSKKPFSWYIWNSKDHREIQWLLTKTAEIPIYDFKFISTLVSEKMFPDQGERSSDLFNTPLPEEQSTKKAAN